MADIPVSGKARENIYRKRLRVRAERLLKLVDLNAHGEIIGNELMLIIEAGMQVYGSDFFFNRLAERTQELLHLKEGLCRGCLENHKPNPNLATGKDLLCDSCRKEADDAFGPGDY